MMNSPETFIHNNWRRKKETLTFLCVFVSVAAARREYLQRHEANQYKLRAEKQLVGGGWAAVSHTHTDSKTGSLTQTLLINRYSHV